MYCLKCWLVEVIVNTVLRSVQFSRSVVSDSLRPHEPQQARPPCPSPTPRVYPNSCPLSWWCYPTISPSVVPFSSCLQLFLTSGSFHSHESALRIRWPKYWSFSFRFDYLLQWLMDSQKHLHLSIYYRIKEIIQKDSQMSRYIGWGLGGSQAQDLLWPWSGGVHGSGKTTLLKSKTFSGKCEKKNLCVTSMHIFLKSITWKSIYLCLRHSIIYFRILKILFSFNILFFNAVNYARDIYWIHH